MTICLVTDRMRWDPVAQARSAVEARIDLIQVRERGIESATLASIVRAIAAATRGTATRVVVNDRLDIALACGADGVHLRGDSMPSGRVRAIAPAGFLVGRSVHSVDEARQAGPVDYVIAGTVFPSASKGPDARPIGLDGLGAIVRASSAPVLAIGGITIDRVAAVASAGAAGVAAIGLFATPGSLAASADVARERFDTAKTAP